MTGFNLNSVGDYLGSFGFSGFDNGTSYAQPRTTATVPNDAVQSMQPVTQAGNSAGGWSDFWKGTAQTIVGYAIAKDAAKYQVPNPGQQQMQPVGQGQAMAPVQRNPLQGLLLPALLVVGGVLIAKALSK